MCYINRHLRIHKQMVYFCKKKWWLKYIQISCPTHFPRFVRSVNRRLGGVCVAHIYLCRINHIRNYVVVYGVFYITLYLKEVSRVFQYGIRSVGDVKLFPNIEHDITAHMTPPRTWQHRAHVHTPITMT